MDLRPYIEKFRKRFAELESVMADPKLFDNPAKAQETTREYSRLKELVFTGDRYLKVVADLEMNRESVKTEPEGSEMALMAKEEITALEAEEAKLHKTLLVGLIPPDAADSRNTIIEIRAGAGGSESALFS